jgi:hypothetical protein
MDLPNGRSIFFWAINACERRSAPTLSISPAVGHLDSPARNSRVPCNHFRIGLCVTPRFTANSEDFPQSSVNAAAFAWRAQRFVRAFGSGRAGSQMELSFAFSEKLSKKIRFWVESVEELHYTKKTQYHGSGIKSFRFEGFRAVSCYLHLKWFLQTKQTAYLPSGCL